MNVGRGRRRCNNGVTNLCGAVTSAPASLVVGTVWLDLVSWENVGPIRLRLISEAGKGCEIWTATNLTDWRFLGTITNQTGADVFSDTATNQFGGFYRLRQLP